VVSNAVVATDDYAALACVTAAQNKRGIGADAIQIKGHVSGARERAVVAIGLFQ
jgi:hypothetical protein